MRKIATIFAICFLSSGCAVDTNAQSDVVSVCRKQTAGAVLFLPDPVPRSLEMWKPTENQVAFGVRQNFLDMMFARDKQAICVLSIRPDMHVIRIDAMHGP